MRPEKFYFVTGNEEKYGEAKLVLPDLQLFRPPEDLVEIQSLDPKEVIQAKLDEVRKRYDLGGIIVEDTSLVFTWLAELPGTFIKHFRSSLGIQGLARLGTSVGVGTAVARTYLGYSRSVGEAEFVLGEVRGAIVSPPRGVSFRGGWGAIFEPEGSDRTLGEMMRYDDWRRFDFSARTWAFKELKKKLGL